MFLVDSEAESFLDHEIRNHKSSKEQITQDYKNLTSKARNKHKNLTIFVVTNS